MIKSKYISTLTKENRKELNNLTNSDRPSNIKILDNKDCSLVIENIRYVKNKNNSRFKQIIKIEFVLHDKSCETKQNFNRFIVLREVY